MMSDSSYSPTEYVHEVLKKEQDDGKRQDIYANWSQTYDQDLHSLGYKGPSTIATIMTGLFPDNKDHVHILDIGAGTGLVSKELRDLGFKEIDALEPNEGMLSIAREKGLYTKYFCEFVPEEGKTTVPDNQYDAITCCGSFGNGHLPCNAVNEMIRITKPGGMIVIVTNPKHMSTVPKYIDKLEPLMDDMESKRKWRRIKKELLPEYYSGVDGLVLVYTVY